MTEIECSVVKGDREGRYGQLNGNFCYFVSSPIHFNNDLDYLLISSDGIESFGLPIGEMVGKITSFKSTNGKFLKKKIGNRLIPDLKKEGYTNFDDISIGGFVREE